MSDDSAREHRRQAAWKYLFGTAPQDFEDEANAPPINDEARKKIRAFIINELSETEAKDIKEMTRRFRSWVDEVIAAYDELLSPYNGFDR